MSRFTVVVHIDLESETEVDARYTAQCIIDDGVYSGGPDLRDILIIEIKPKIEE